MNLRARIILTALVVVALVNISSVVYFVERERGSAVTRLRDTIQETVDSALKSAGLPADTGI